MLNARTKAAVMFNHTRRIQTLSIKPQDICAGFKIGIIYFLHKENICFSQHVFTINLHDELDELLREPRECFFFGFFTLSFLGLTPFFEGDFGDFGLATAVLVGFGCGELGPFGTAWVLPAQPILDFTGFKMNYWPFYPVAFPKVATITRPKSFPSVLPDRAARVG